MCALRATARWALTGTPVQNKLSDLASVYQFLRVYPYQDHGKFKDHVIRLCSMQGSEDAIEKLKRLIRCITLRRSISTVQLPEREDKICKLNFGEDEREAYNKAKARTERLLGDALNSEPHSGLYLNVLQKINNLRQICNLGTLAPRVNADSKSEALSEKSWDSWSAQTAFDSLVAACSAQCRICSVDMESAVELLSEDSSERLLQPQLCSCTYLVCGPCSQKSECLESACENRPAHTLMPISTSAPSTPLPLDTWSNTSKLPTKVSALLDDVSDHIEDEKCVVFSYWTTTLDVVEAGLRAKGQGYIRFDGKVSDKKRITALRSFRSDPSVRVALLTLSCGAVGLDLTAASRAYLMEPHWNPSLEQQALARIYRMGQSRTVTTIRYIMRDSFEDVG